MKALLLADSLSVMDDRICPPPTREPADLGDLLSTVAERLESGGVLMLSGRWARYVTPYAAAGGTDGRSMPSAAGDWTAQIQQDDTWVRWTHDGHAIWTCEVDAIEPGGKQAPLIDSDPMVTAAHFDLWRQVTSVGWVGTPGMAGSALLIDGWRTMNPKAAEPLWGKNGIWYPLEERPAWPFGLIEQPYTAAKWSRDYTGPMHGYDLNKAYLSAYQVAELPVGILTLHTAGPGYDFNPAEGTLWRVTLSPWRYEQLLPDPAGYAPTLEDGSRWVTTPTLVLLQQLTDRGDYAGFTVHEFWGGSPTRRVTRKWAELINDLAGAAREPLASAARYVYKQTYGMWARGGRIRRPEWHYIIIATARANLWRKLDVALRTTVMGVQPTLENISFTEAHAQAPVRVETDCAFYAGITDWEADAPAGFRLDETGIRLGHFKPYVPKEDR